MVKKWHEGAELVYAIRRDRIAEKDRSLRGLFSRAFYAVFRKIAEVKLPEGAGDFCLLDRKVIDAVNALPERNRFMKGLVSWVGFRHAEVTFEVGQRVSGMTHWNFFRLLRFAFDGLSGFSTLPLRIWTWSGAAVSLVAIGYMAFIWRCARLFMVLELPGYASMMVQVFFYWVGCNC